MRLLYFCAAHYNMHIMITHIAGANNVIADAISWFQMQRSGHWLWMPTHNQITSMFYQSYPLSTMESVPVLRYGALYPTHLPIWSQMLLQFLRKV